ncbi:MAG: hypothetical protein ABW166_13690 [Sedimenticola sp.]
MATGSLLNLSYLIEISLVINLAYHELKTFRLRDNVRMLGSTMKDRYKDMMTAGTEEFVIEYSQLISFHTGEDRDAWRGNRCRPFYHHLIFKGGDRLIIRGVLCLIVAMLLFNTAFATAPIDSPFSLTHDPFSTIWSIQFFLLATSIFIPSFFMIMVRSCYRYIFGGVPETPAELIGSKGRMRDLEQAILKKHLALAKITATNSHEVV